MIMTQNPAGKKTITPHTYDYKSWPLDCLANYIEKLQRKTVTETANIIFQHARLVKSFCATQPAIFFELEKQFYEMIQRLSVHMRKEEQHLFPFIRQMMLDKEINRRINRLALERITWLIDKLKEDHAVEKKSLQLSAELRENYLAVVNVSRPIRNLLIALIDFEQTCELHIKLQNTILFPTIVALKYDVV
jgi:regulator of cell morphogenesis and NO signaling